MPSVEFSQNLMFPIPSPMGLFACHSCVDSQMPPWICAVFSVFPPFLMSFFITMHHAACKVVLQPSIGRTHSRRFSFFFIVMFFLGSVAAVLLLLLLLPPLLVSPVSTFLEIKIRLSVVSSSPSQCVCPPPLPDGCCCRHYFCCAAIPRWTIDRLCPRRCGYCNR